MTNRARFQITLSLAGVFILVILFVLFFLNQGLNASSVVVYTSVDQIFSEPVFRQFESKTGIRVRALYDTEETKSTGVLNRLIAESDNRQADVFWSGDPVRPFLLINRGLVEPYISPQSQQIPANFKAADGMWTGIAARARVLLVNREKLGSRAMPKSVRDLADEQWRGEIAFANPVFGTTTMHVAAWSSVWGVDETKEFLNALKQNRIIIASSNGEVKRLVAAGEATIGLTDTDDAYVALQSGAPVEVVYPDQDGFGALLMPAVVVLMRGGPNPEPARRLIDYLLSAEVETMLAESAAHIPLQPGATRPNHVSTFQELHAMQVDYADIAKRMEEIQPWLRKWTGL